MAKMLDCGATREMTPSTRLTSISMATMGRAIHKPMEKICAPQVWGIVARRKPKGSGPTGKASRLCTTAWITVRWPLSTMNRKPTRVAKKRLAAVPCEASTGSKKPAKFRPICRPASSPANSTAANTTRTAKPSDTPISTC